MDNRPTYIGAPPCNRNEQCQMPVGRSRKSWLVRNRIPPCGFFETARMGNHTPKQVFLPWWTIMINHTYIYTFMIIYKLFIKRELRPPCLREWWWQQWYIIPFSRYVLFFSKFRTNPQMKTYIYIYIYKWS